MIGLQRLLLIKDIRANCLVESLILRKAVQIVNVLKLGLGLAELWGPGELKLV